MTPEAEKIKAALRFDDGRDWEANHGIIKDLLSLDKVEQNELVPLLTDRYAANRFIIDTDSLIELFVQTRDPAIVAAMKKRFEWEGLHVSGKCRLLRAGVAELEPALLKYLWNNRCDARQLERREAASAIGDCGGPESLTLLEAILPELAGSIPEKRVAIERDDDIKQRFLGGMDLRLDKLFLKSVRDAIVSIRRRLES